MRSLKDAKHTAAHLSLSRHLIAEIQRKRAQLLGALASGLQKKVVTQLALASQHKRPIDESTLRAAIDLRSVSSKRLLERLSTLKKMVSPSCATALHLSVALQLEL